MKKIRLAYLVSHPIQYQAPLLRRINQEPDIDLTTLFCSDLSAKEYRDTYMRAIAPIFPKFGWEKNVGYGTKIHRGALKIYGPTIHHRSLFIKNWV